MVSLEGSSARYVAADSAALFTFPTAMDIIIYLMMSMQVLDLATPMLIIFLEIY